MRWRCSWPPCWPCRPRARRWPTINKKSWKTRKNQIQQELDALKQEQTQNQETIDSAEAQRETATKKKDLLQQQMAVIQQKIDDLDAQIAEKEQEITDKQAEVDAKQAEFDGQLDAFKERLTAMQRLNTSGAIDLLSNASNMFQLLTFNRVLDSIAAQDQRSAPSWTPRKSSWKPKGPSWRPKRPSWKPRKPPRSPTTTT